MVPNDVKNIMEMEGFVQKLRDSVNESELNDTQIRMIKKTVKAKEILLKQHKMNQMQDKT